MNNWSRWTPSISHVLAFVVWVSVGWGLFFSISLTTYLPSMKPSLDEATTTTRISAFSSLNYEPSHPEQFPPGTLFDPVTVPARCTQDKRRRIVDVTMINMELSLLELRLNELWNVVDTFFIMETAIPFKPGAPLKKLHLTNHWKDFSKFHSKIQLLVLDKNVSEGAANGAFNIQNQQRDELCRKVKEKLNPGEEDLFIWADLDEIPRPHEVEKLACAQNGTLPETPICLKTSKDGFYYYNYRCHQTYEWTGRPAVQHYSAKFQQGGGCKSSIANASTHCSSCFDSIDEYHIKARSNSEPVRNERLQYNNASILERVRKCKDFWLRDNLNKRMKLMPSVDFRNIPIIVSNHPERWPHLLRQGSLYDTNLTL